jgi:DNA-binding transcriptional regulator YiaG
LKGEIRRLARKEVRETFMPLKKLVAGLRRRVAQQRRLIADMERNMKRVKSQGRAVEAAPSSEESQIRFSPAWVKRHRKNLKMSRRVYAKLVGVSAQSIFGWESGRTRPRRAALKAWRRIRGMGKRELSALISSEGTDGRRRGARGKKRGRTAAKAKRARPPGNVRRAAKKARGPVRKTRRVAKKK